MLNSKKIMEVGSAAIRQIAKKEGISEAAVRAEMESAIRDAYDPSNPYWANSPFADRVPTPEEFIVWTTELMRS